MAEAASSNSLGELTRAAWAENLPGLTVRYAYRAADEAAIRRDLRLLQIELEEIPAETEQPAEMPDAGEEETGEEGDAPAQEDILFPEGYTPWEINFYPPMGESTIVEIFFTPQT